MSALEFISEIAWPVAILAVAVAYRSLFTSLLDRNMTRFKAGPFEMAWEQAAEVARSRRPAPIEPLAPAAASVSSSTPRRVSQLVVADPQAAILEMYSAVEAALRDALRLRGIESGEDADALALVRTGESADLFDPTVTDAILGLQVLRNLAAHAPSGRHLEPSKAREYVAMAEGALFAVAMATRQAPKRTQKAA